MKNVKILLLAIIIISGIIFLTQDQTVENDLEIETSEISYEAVFHSTWTEETHPNEYPSNAHFSPIVIVSHNGEEKIFESGKIASEGIQDMAETGATRKLSNEINQIINSENALDFSIGNVIFLNNVNKTNPVNITVSTNYSKITAVSMIAPSPDWFVAIEDFELYEDGEWLPNTIVNVIAYDAGTDSGTTFKSQNRATTPKSEIELIEDGPLAENGFVKSMGYIFFKRN